MLMNVPVLKRKMAFLSDIFWLFLTDSVILFALSIMPDVRRASISLERLINFISLAKEADT